MQTLISGLSFGAAIPRAFSGGGYFFIKIFLSSFGSPCLSISFQRTTMSVCIASANTVSSPNRFPSLPEVHLVTVLQFLFQDCEEGPRPCRKIWSGRWSAQSRNVGSQCWLSILDRWSIEAWMIIADLYSLVILAPKSLPTIGRELLPELSRWSFKFIMILIMTIKFKTQRIINTY